MLGRLQGEHESIAHKQELELASPETALSLPTVPCRPLLPADKPQQPEQPDRPLQPGDVGESAAIIGDPYVSVQCRTCARLNDNAMLQKIVQWCWTMQQHPAYATSSQSPNATACSSLQVRGFDRDWFEFAGEPGGTYTLLTTGDGAQLDATFAAGGLKGMATFVRSLHFWQVRGHAWLLAGCSVCSLAMLCRVP